MKLYYDRRAPEYDATSYGTIEHRELVAFVAGLTAGRILDVACGTAYLTRHLGGKVVALDQSEAMLEIARERLPDAELVRADVPPLPFADDRFDLVFTANFLSHLPHPVQREHLVAEALRVAGELVVVEEAWRPGLARESWEDRPLADGSSHRVFKRYYTAAELAEALGGEVRLSTATFIAVSAHRPA
jgi:ubiquinone/menaquinone biosynthesis C-methylase UbiE